MVYITIDNFKIYKGGFFMDRVVNPSQERLTLLINNLN